MAEPVTEILYMPLKEGIDLDGGKDKELFGSLLKTLASQKGMKRVFWGRQIEKPDVLQMAIDWENLNSHTTFQESADYQPFLDRVGTILSGRPSVFHAKIPVDTESPDPFSAPITECISAYFSPDHDEDAWYRSSWTTFKSEAAKIENSKAKGVIGGWSIERHTHENLGDGVEGKLFAAFIGWPSVEDHMEFRKTEDFPKIIPYLREGVKGMSMHHVAFQQYK